MLQTEQQEIPDDAWKVHKVGIILPGNVISMLKLVKYLAVLKNFVKIYHTF